MNVYLDNAATTPVLPEVVQAMQLFFTKHYGNPSSPHTLGEEAEKEMQNARTVLARTIGAKPEEIVFTSGGTEANNLAVLGLAAAKKDKKKIVVSAIEHSSVWEPAMSLKERGYDVVVVPVTAEGIVEYAALERAIDEKTLLVSVMHVNNEIGTIQDIRAIGELCRKRGAHFHTDAVQSFGKLLIDVRKNNIDLLTASAHKLGGPKGIGFLYLRSGIKVQPRLIGGGQERGIRAGTENVAGIIGFAVAVEKEKNVSNTAVKKSRDELLLELEKLGGVLNGAREEIIQTHCNVAFPSFDAELLVQKLSQRGVYCSTRSACLSKQQKENRVLQALGLPRQRQESSIRLSLHKPLTNAELRKVIRAFREALRK
jgi:cysteine desulfurase